MKKNIVCLELQRQKGCLCYMIGNNLILSKIQKKKQIKILLRQLNLNLIHEKYLKI